ncbi:UDP-glycosyltransferase 83A1-like [Prosopis cineraria]|uniref:UDP-glycosyltransferase 83A1-like n=1 Tax=Prosopis cineraria TaxID=364024 RepID=UPI002410A3A8|nr:UDP-glycosyltransferase 83A1-like [Prosopis cineraria]
MNFAESAEEKTIGSRMAKPHVLVIPYPVQGHVIPLMELSLSLVKHGIKVTFLNTKYNHERIISSFPEGSDIESQLCLVWIADSSESAEKTKKPVTTGEVLKHMPGKVEELIDCMNGSETEKINCVLADQSIGWALDIAEKKGIWRAAFCPAAAAQLVLGLIIPKLIENGIIDKNGTPLRKQTIQLSPTMPSISTENLAWLNVGNQTTQRHIFELMMRNIKSMQLPEWLLCNSNFDLEPFAFKEAPNIIPIGPLMTSNPSGNSAGNFWPQDLTIMKWLDQQSPSSVIYVAFGSFRTMSLTQFQELALGLELSNRPFVWVVQPDFTEGKNYEYPEGFEDRVGDRGRMVGWSPQRKILTHSSVACFISHCGWNSTMESVSNGVPILCWPHFADQFLNKSYVCDVWNVGMDLEQDRRGIITSSEIRNKIEQVLNDGDLKERSKLLKKKVLNGIRQGGSSSNNLDSFIKWIKTKN